MTHSLQYLFQLHPENCILNTLQHETSTIPLYVSNDAWKGEILLGMKHETPKYSQGSIDDFPELMKTSFPDSRIARDFAYGSTKVGYIINYGKLWSTRTKSCRLWKNLGSYKACFDESLSRYLIGSKWMFKLKVTTKMFINCCLSDGLISSWSCFYLQR